MLRLSSYESVDTETPSECVCGCIRLGVFPFAVLLRAEVIDDAWMIINTPMQLNRHLHLVKLYV